MLSKMLNLIIPVVYQALSLFTIHIGMEGGKAEKALNKTVQTENLSGLNTFLATAYNNNRLLYAIVSTGSIIVFGLIVTYLIGLILKPKYHLNKEE